MDASRRPRALTRARRQDARRSATQCGRAPRPPALEADQRRRILPPPGSPPGPAGPEPRPAEAAGGHAIGHDDRGRRLAAELLDLATGALDRLVGAVARTSRRRRPARWPGSRRRSGSRPPGVRIWVSPTYSTGRRAVGRAGGGHRRQHADRPDPPVGVHVLPVEGRRIHPQFEGIGLVASWYEGYPRGGRSMKIKAANGLARILKAEGIPWVSCYPTNHVNNALGEEGVPILMMGEERFAVAVADAFSRVTCGKQIGVCTVMANLNAAGIQMAYGAIAQAWEDSSPLLVIAEGVGQGAQPAHPLRHGRGVQVGHQVGGQGRPRRAGARLRAPRLHPSPLRAGPGPVLLIIPRDLGEYDEDEHPYTPVKGWRSGPDPDDVRSAVKRAAGREGPAALRGRGRALRRRHRRAAAVRRARPGAGADDAQGQGRLPREPPAVGRRARLARRALPAARRRALLDRLEPLPQPVQPRHSRRRTRRPSSSARWTRSTSTAATRRATP